MKTQVLMTPVNSNAMFPTPALLNKFLWFCFWWNSTSLYSGEGFKICKRIALLNSRREKCLEKIFLKDYYCIRKYSPVV